MSFVPLSIRYVLSVYLSGLVFFTFFRLLLLFTAIQQLAAVPHSTRLICFSLLKGLQFDTVISSYMLALPALVLILAELSAHISRRLLFATHAFLSFIYAIAFLICAADVPFFANYGYRLNITIFNWVSSPLFMVKIVLQDTAFLGYLLLFIGVSLAFTWLTSRIYKRFKILIPLASPISSGKVVLRLGVSLVFLCLVFLGMRGRTDEKSPIVVGTAYFCNYNLPNQAGLNPVFTLMSSWEDARKEENRDLHLADDKGALAYVQHYLQVPVTGQGIKRPIAGIVTRHTYNVVVIIMESMTADNMARFGNDERLTPNLDTLAQNAYFFPNFYSAGIHTFNGIFSTLYGYPALMARHTMEGAMIASYSGMPAFFDERGYETMYFTTHDDQFDNVGGFLRANYIHTIISKKDYPPEEVLSTLGVPDHYMFDYSLPLLNKQRSPFFAVYMTASNHNPYIVPNNISFKPGHPDARGGCVEYADWAIGRYMHRAATMPWYDSTIFVLLGDHGSQAGTPYGSMFRSFNHIPCIIYSPMFRKAHKEITSPGGQIDVFPTIAGLLGGNYNNNAMGIDLMHSSRRWMFFSQDDKVGIIDTAMLCLWQKNGPESMYKLAGHEVVLPQADIADSMKAFAFNMIQCAQWLKLNNKTGK